MRRFAVVLALFSLCAMPVWGEVITLKTGEILRGKIVSRTGEKIVVEAPPNNHWEVELSRIASIEEREPLLVDSRARFRSAGDTDADGYYRIAVWCAEKGLFDVRETVLQWVIAIDPDHEKARADLGFYRTADGRWLKGTGGGGATEGKFREALKLYRKKEDGKAVKLLQEIIDQNPTDLDANYLLGDIYYVSGKAGHARQQFEAVVKAGPNHPWGHYGMAVLALDEKKYEEADLLIRRAIGLAASATPPSYRKAMEAEFYYVLGLSLKGKGDASKPDAEKAFRECVARDRANYKAWTEIGALEGEKGRYKDAADAFKSALQAKGRYAPAVYNWGISLYQQGDIEGAMAKLTPLVRTNPPYVEALLIVGRCYHRYGKASQALQYYTRYQQLGGKDPRVAEWLLDVKK
jgi:tetratricopeptide (TPR) repeat protein